ncbi:uncharacterized protein L203_102305 [Cryptococcus depauperatus CBS 7841]|uniref:HTH APSES-type domain-containing protein n=1 Tax=Cryptococcus depauperatus CBS 7841 TaxID=1295531 RepID=A0AAJ8JRJ9_9TREE
MARPIRPTPTSATPIAGASTSLRSSTRYRPSASSSATPSTPASTPGPSTPQSDGIGARGNGRESLRKSFQVEAKAHGLRSTGSAIERQPCPFPAQWGGRANCGIAEDDEADEVLMGTLSAIAFYENRALSAEEIAYTCFQQGWLRQPSAAIEPATLINNAIRSYVRRCEKSNRHCLLAKHQLAGSVVESVLEVALHPNAFEGSIRPKGTVWYLSSGAGAGTGKCKWKSPFEGLEIPKIPPRRPVSKKKELKQKKELTKAKGKDKPLALVKIKLVVGENGEDCTERSSRSRSRSMSLGKENVMKKVKEEIPTAIAPIPINKRVADHKLRELVDSSSDSDSSDSDQDILPSSRLRMPRSMRKGPPPPLIIHGSPRAHGPNRPPPHSPFTNHLFYSPSLSSNNIFATPHMSPFPSHSLDNTTWTAHHDCRQRFDSSCSSSDDEVTDPEWGLVSDILVKESVDDNKPSWALEEEAKVKEATDALKVLFPLEDPDEETMSLGSAFEPTKPEMRPNGMDSPILSEPTSNATSATARAALGNKLKAIDAGGLSFNAWVANSSPIPSPKARPLKSFHAYPQSDFSPAQHFSKLHESFDPEVADIDDGQWLDESGELPVKAEDTLSDVDIGSTIDEMASPEHDRRLHTALWAQEASATICVKSEPEDFPTPSSIEDEPLHCSRESMTPSYSTSESPDYDEYGHVYNANEVIVGPESVSIDELDGWLPGAVHVRTPHRIRTGKGKKEKTDAMKLGTWGGIGVGSAAKRTSRTSAFSARRRKSKSCCIKERLMTPESDRGDKSVVCEVEVDDAIGTEDLEKARVEAEKREEQHRKACKEKAERHRAMLEAYRQTIRAEMSDNDIPSSSWEGPQSAFSWGSDPFQLSTFGILSPMVLHGVSNLSLSNSSEQPLAVDPKALVSPLSVDSFNTSGTQADFGMGLGVGMLDAALTQQEVDVIMGTASDVSSALPLVSPSQSPPPSAITSVSLGRSTPPPISPSRSVASSASPTAVISVQPTPIPVIFATAPNEKTSAMVALPTSVPDLTQTSTIASVSAPPLTSTSTRSSRAVNGTKNVTSCVHPPFATNTSASNSSMTSGSFKSCTQTSSGAPSRSSTPSTIASSNNNCNGSGNKSGGKIATITKPLCPGVDACVVDNIPVYAHIYESKNGPGKQVLLRRLDTDFVNANALLQALGVSPSKHSEYLDHPISQARLAARHVVSPSISGVEYSHGVSGIWVHLSEAREFARRAQLTEGSLLASLLREDLFQLFATLAGLKPDHPPSESFGLPFVPRRHSSPSTTSTNSKSTSNPLSLSASALSSNHIRSGIGASDSTSAPKTPLVRSAVTAPEGCPQPKRRRATISSPVTKKLRHSEDLVPIDHVQPQAKASIARTKNVTVPKRSTRASIGSVPLRASTGK